MRSEDPMEAIFSYLYAPKKRATPSYRRYTKKKEEKKEDLTKEIPETKIEAPAYEAPVYEAPALTGTTGMELGIQTPAVTLPPAPEIPITAPEVIAPEIPIEAPEIALPAAPEITAPRATLPELEAPVLPDLTVPEITPPKIAPLDVGIETMPLPSVDVGIGGVELPEITLPEMVAPEIPIPEITAPALPEFAAPDIGIRGPDLGLGQIGLNLGDMINAPLLGEWEDVAQKAAPGLGLEDGRVTFKPTLEQQLDIGGAVSDVMKRAPVEPISTIGEGLGGVVDVGKGVLDVVKDVTGKITPWLPLIGFMQKFAYASSGEWMNKLSEAGFRDQQRLMVEQLTENPKQFTHGYPAAIEHTGKTGELQYDWRGKSTNEVFDKIYIPALATYINNTEPEEVREFLQDRGVDFYKGLENAGFGDVADNLAKYSTKDTFSKFVGWKATKDLSEEEAKITFRAQPAFYLKPEEEAKIKTSSSKKRLSDSTLRSSIRTYGKLIGSEQKNRLSDERLQKKIFETEIELAARAKEKGIKNWNRYLSDATYQELKKDTREKKVAKKQAPEKVLMAAPKEEKKIDGMERAKQITLSRQKAMEELAAKKKAEVAKKPVQQPKGTKIFTGKEDFQDFLAEQRRRAATAARERLSKLMGG